MIQPLKYKTIDSKWHLASTFLVKAIFFRSAGRVRRTRRHRSGCVNRAQFILFAVFYYAGRQLGPGIVLIIVNERRAPARSRLRLFTSRKGHRVHIAEAALLHRRHDSLCNKLLSLCRGDNGGRRLNDILQPDRNCCRIRSRTRSKLMELVKYSGKA